jgi:hypothetical protein
MTKEVGVREKDPAASVYKKKNVTHPALVTFSFKITSLLAHFSHS